MNGDFEKRLYQALIEAYAPDELAIMVRLELNQKIDLISKGGRLDVVVFDLIQWAATQPKMAGLPAAAAQFKIDKKSRVPVLEALRDEYRVAAQTPPAVPPPASRTDVGVAVAISPSPSARAGRRWCGAPPRAWPRAPRRTPARCGRTTAGCRAPASSS